MLNRKRNNRRREAHGSRWQLPALPWRLIALSGGTVAALGAMALLLSLLLNQPIERITVDGSFQRISAIEVEKVVRARLDGAGLVRADLAELQRALRELPWVDRASIQRSWPGGLRVHVIEQVAVARWNDSSLINVSGQLFLSEPRFVPPELPRLAGPAGTEGEVVARYLATQGRLVESGMRLVSMRLDARGAWELSLDNGVNVRLGRSQVDQRMARFIDVALRIVSQRAADIAYLDMRYTNGFAIGWRGSSRLAGGPTQKDLNPDV